MTACLHSDDSRCCTGAKSAGFNFSGKPRNTQHLDWRFHLCERDKTFGKRKNMPLPKRKAWFPSKAHGWGWGFPCRWQGWVVFFAFIGALVAGVPLLKLGQLMFVGYSVGLLLIFVALALWKGEKPHWSWRKHE